MATDVTLLDAGRRDPLTAALLPVLMHRLNNATQLLLGLNSLLASGGGTHLAERRGADLAQASQAIDEVGWLLGVLASASGADLLLARRARRGLAPVVVAVREALRRCDRELGPSAEPLPDLASGIADGWQVPWGVGVWLFSSAIVLAERSSLDWRLRQGGDFDELACRSPEDARRDALERRITERLPEARFRRTQDEHGLLLPRGVLLWSGGPP
jgi:hypothetical protein